MLQRVVTGVVAAAIALAAILWREPWALIVIGGLVLVSASVEAGKLTPGDKRGVSLMAAVGVALGVFFLTTDQNLVPALGLLWVVGNLMQFVRFPKCTLGFLGFSIWIVVTIAVSCVLQLQHTVDWGQLAPNLLLLALLPLWVGDSLGYFVGRAIGRHKLAPTISPNKTWEGAVANFVGCVGTAVGLGAWMGVPLVACVAVGLSTGVLGQVGDLLQSRLKRLAEVKDSGSVLPGHGGVLDRLDSFLFSSYPSFLALWLLAPDTFHVKHWPWQ